MTYKKALSFAFAQIAAIFKLVQLHQSLNLKFFDNLIVADYPHMIMIV